MTIDAEWMNEARAEVHRSGFASFHVDEIPTNSLVAVVDLLDELRAAFLFVQVWIPLGVAHTLADAIELRSAQAWESATTEPTAIYFSNSAEAFEPLTDEHRTSIEPLPGQPEEADTFLTYLRDGESAEKDWEYSVGLWVFPVRYRGETFCDAGR